MPESPGSGSSLLSSRRRHALGMVLSWLAVSLPAFWVFPSLDNWTWGRPMTQVSWDILRPRLFWRPFEMFNFALIGALPFLYPWYLHLLAVLGHGASGLAVHHLVRRAGADPRAAAWATTLFLVSPAVGASVWNILGVTQTWSTALGLASVWAYVAFREGRAGASWIGLAALSSIWKESGLAFFLAAPILGEWVRVSENRGSVAADSPPRRVGAGMMTGVASLAVYGLLRWVLRPSAPLGLPTGRYSVHADPLLWSRNLLMLLGVSLTSVDTVAVFGSPWRPLWAITSLLAGLPLMGMVVVGVMRVWSLKRWSLAALSILAVSSVYLPMGHVSEKYAHPFVAVLAILLAGGAATASHGLPRQSLGAALGLFLLSAAAVDAHKLTEMIRTGRGSQEVAARIVSQTVGAPPFKVCLVTVGRENAHIYSIFQGEPGPASGWGLSVLPHWNWRFPWSVMRVDRREDCGVDRDTVWTVSVDGRVSVDRLR